MREKTGIRIKKYSHEEEHVAWPINALKLKEVKNEIEMLLNETFVSLDAPRTEEIVKKWGPRGWIAVSDGKGGLKQLRGIEAINTLAYDFGAMFNELLDLYKKYNVKFSFIFFNI